MIQVTLNLENEHVLSENVKGLLDSLSKEQVQEIAKKALFKYLTDSIDYEKQIYLNNSIAESRKSGIKTSSSYDSKTADELINYSDDAIKNLSAFKEKYLKSYKSSKESRFEEINSFIDTEIKARALEFVRENKELNNLVSDKQKTIADNFETIIKDTMLAVATTLIAQTISNASIGSSNFLDGNNIREILSRHNIY